jgi:hypothetical protein
VLVSATDASLAPVAQIDGFRLASIIDASTGMILAAAGDQEDPRDPGLLRGGGLMSQSSVAARLAVSARRGRAPDSYGAATAARLRRLAAAGRTGMLPFAGHSDGAIYFSGGRVVYAESARTPGPAPQQDAPGAATLAVEPVADAALDLLASQSSPARFRSARLPAASLASGMTVDSLLTEVGRRRRILDQVSATVTPDTTVLRSPRMSARSVQVSALQWAMLIRVGDGSTPRSLAWELRRSVFGTTLDVYRLMVLRLLAALDYRSPHGPAALRESPPRGVLALSYVRAVAGPGGAMPALPPGSAALGSGTGR